MEDKPKFDIAKSFTVTNPSERAGFVKNYSWRKKGLHYKLGEMPYNVWLMGIMTSNNKQYWTENDGKRYKEWFAKHPEYAN